MNPVATNPLHTRADFERAVSQLFEPLIPHFSPGKARVKSTATGAQFSDTSIQLEGFARPLWGVVPLGKQSDFDWWSEFRTGLVNGTDPSHPEYWGTAEDYSQKYVEMAAIGFGLALAPEHLWKPLSSAEKERVATWLNQINDGELYDCNWLFFRVIVNLGLRSVGANHDWELTQSSLDRLDSFYQKDGWYTDGPKGDKSPIDYYLPWAMHFYGLIYAVIVGDEDQERVQRIRERASSFATSYTHWFDDEGRAIPYGRSLTYRFAQASFWGGLAFAGLNPLPWGTIRGLWARNIRWWLDQPIFTDGGLLSIGYRYPTLKMSEGYNSPNSPYWAMKAFLPLALEQKHPFWQAEEQSLPNLPDLTVQSEAGKIICRDDHLFALSLPQDTIHGREKYSKFAYSAHFGFSVTDRTSGPGKAGHESSLALSLDGEQYKIPANVRATNVEQTTLMSRWEPWEDVTVKTWLAPELPGHARVHQLKTDRWLHSQEGGFALDRSKQDNHSQLTYYSQDSTARARSPSGISEISDVFANREPAVVEEKPNTNLNYSRTVVPTLEKRYEPGEYWLASTVMASPNRQADWDLDLEIDVKDDHVSIALSEGETILECNSDDL